MANSKNQKPQSFKKTNEQKEADKELMIFLNENNENENGEISLAIYRLKCLDFVGGNKLTLKMVHDILPIAFDKYIERGFKLTDNQKNILLNNKEKIISLIKPFYWDENGNVCGMSFQVGLLDHIDGFGGCFNLDTENFEMNKFKKPTKIPFK